MWTVTEPSAVTTTTVTARVVGEAVQSGTVAADVSWRTSAVVTGDQVNAGAAITTRP